MKSLVRPVVLALFATSILATVSGCKSPGGDARPGEIRPGVARRGPGPKGPNSAIPITIVNIAPTPTAVAKGKKTTARRKTAEMPASTSVPFNFKIASEFWPSGANEVNATIKCYEVASVFTTNDGYQIKTVGSALAVFGDSTTSKEITIPRNGSVTEYLTFSSGTCLDKQLMVGITGWDDIEENEYGGGEIFVVSQ